MKRYVFSLKIKQLRNIRFLEFFCNLRTRSPYFYTFKLPAKVQTSLDYPQHNTVPRKGGNYFNSASFNPASSNRVKFSIGPLFCCVSSNRRRFQLDMRVGGVPEIRTKME